METLPGIVDVKDNISAAIADLAPFASDPHSLFFHSLSVMHTPRYRTENSGALLSDWPRIPLPATADLLTRSVELGLRLAELLDAESAVHFGTEWSFLGV